MVPLWFLMAFEDSVAVGDADRLGLQLGSDMKEIFLSLSIYPIKGVLKLLLNA